LSFGLIFYFSTFSIFANISSGLIIGSNMGERFLFLPSLSFCFLVVFGLYNLGLKIKNNAPYLFPALVLLPFLAGFTWKSFDRTKDWKNGFTITSQGAIDSPNSWRTHALYGEELKKMGLELKKTNQDSSSKLLLLAKLEYESMLEIFEEKTPVFQYIGSYADVLWNLGDSTGALNMLEENVRINPKGFYALFQLGRLNFELKNYEIAVDYYLRALKANNPNFGPTYRNLGLTYNRLNQKGNAVITLEKSLEYWDDPEIRRSVGFLYSELGAFEKAASFLIADEAKTPEEILFVNSILKGNNAFSKQNYRAAIPEYQKIVPIYDLVDGRSKFQTFYAVYAQSLSQTGDTVNSQKYFLLAANEIKSKDPVVYTNLGTIAFLKDKKFAQAEEYYQKAIDLDVKDKFNGYSNLGMTQLVQRKERDAMKSFEKALEYGQNKTLISNLFLISKSLGETEKMKHYGDKLGIK
jgi:tetratricopeptide (TPR) repeat protein